jgi:predicted DNA-binding protein (MmcQ/YjbR family)
MRYSDIEKHCLALPGATMSIQWGDDHIFKVGGKMFAGVGIENGRAYGLSFKTADDTFHILTRMPNIVPAPYMARAHWVMLKKGDALPMRDLKAYLTRAHALVAAKLPKKTRAALGIGE